MITKCAGEQIEWLLILKEKDVAYKYPKGRKIGAICAAHVLDAFPDLMPPFVDVVCNAFANSSMDILNILVVDDDETILPVGLYAPQIIHFVINIIPGET